MEHLHLLMSLRLPTFQSGRPLLEQVTADKLNQLVDAIRQCELQSGVGYDVNKNSGGATLTIRQQGHQYVQGDGVKRLIGLSNSGMSHTDASVVVNPGVESYNFFCKTPTGSYSTAFVHGMTYSSYLTFNTENNYGKITFDRKRISINNLSVNSTGVSLSTGDLYRRIGLLSAFQGDSYVITRYLTGNYTSQCDAITSGEYVSSDLSLYKKAGSCISVTGDELGTDISTRNVLLRKYTGSATATIGINVCSGVTYVVGATCTGSWASSYYISSPSGSVTGNFRKDAYDSAEASFQTGNYSFKRVFDLGSISPSSAKIRVKARIGSGSFVSVKLNGQNASYASFETQTSTFVPIEITDGFISGQNELEIIISSTSASIYPSVSFEFLPTTATIESSTGFAALTAAQKDLIGDGTPVQVTVGTTSSLYAYNGSGDKGTTAAYTFLRDV